MRFSLSEMIRLFFSAPIPTLTKDFLISSCVIYSLFSPAARIAASFIRFSRSAPVKPAVVCAICFKSTSSARGFFLAWTPKISSLPPTSGLPTTTFLSKRPGRMIAGSSISTRFVAAMTIMPSLTPKPSISTSIWFNVCSRSSCPPPIPVPRRLATASISSINTIQGAFFLASSNKSLTREAPTPTNISTKSDPEMVKNGTPASPATALARRVLPVPGGPTRRTPFGILAPSLVYFPGSRRKSTISAISSFSSFKPATSENLIWFSSCVVSFARFLPKFIILPPPPCAAALLFITAKSMNMAPNTKRYGSSVIIQLSAGTSATV